MNKAQQIAVAIAQSSISGVADLADIMIRTGLTGPAIRKTVEAHPEIAGLEYTPSGYSTSGSGPFAHSGTGRGSYQKAMVSIDSKSAHKIRAKLNGNQA